MNPFFGGAIGWSLFVSWGRFVSLLFVRIASFVVVIVSSVVVVGFEALFLAMLLLCSALSLSLSFSLFLLWILYTLKKGCGEITNVYFFLFFFSQNGVIGANQMLPRWIKRSPRRKYSQEQPFDRFKLQHFASRVRKLLAQFWFLSTGGGLNAKHPGQRTGIETGSLC